MDDNDVFFLMGTTQDYKTRIKGYYGCPTCGEYINNIPKKMAECPFCGKMNELVLKLDSRQEQITTGIWKDAGYYSDRRAGRAGGE